MSAVTIRLPDDKYERLKALSKRRGGQAVHGLALLAKAQGK